MAKIVAELNAASLPLAAGDLWRVEQNGLPFKITKTQMIAELAGAEINDLTVAVTWANVPLANIPNLPTSQITTGTFATGRISEGSVTQHEAALTILESQITDGSLLARLAANENVAGQYTFSNVDTPVRLTSVATGNVIMEMPGTGISHIRKITNQGGWSWGTDSSFVLHAGDTVDALVTGLGLVAGSTDENANIGADAHVQLFSNTQTSYAAAYMAQLHSNGQWRAYFSDKVDHTFMSHDGTDGHIGVSTGVLNLDDHTRFDDNIQAQFGTDNDARMYFSGTDLFLDMVDGVDFRIRGGAALDTMISIIQDGRVNLYHNNIQSLRTSLLTTSDVGMGAEVKDGDANFRPIGMNVSLPQTKNAAYTFLLADNGQTMRQTDTTNRVWTVPDDSTIPAGAMYGLAITGSGGVNLTGATGVTVIHFDASTAGGNSKTAGVHVLSDPCAGSLHKITDTLWHLFADNAA